MAKLSRQNFVTAMANRYGTRLRGFLSRRLRNEVDAPDLAQEVFLRLMRVENHETIRSPEAYLFTVASHVLYQHMLKQSGIPASVDIADLCSDLQLISGDDPVARTDTAQRVERLERSMKTLPPKISAALLLHRFAGFSIEEIGQHLGVSRPTAKKYLARGLMHVRDVCEDGEGKGDL
jgi:RNA polymerase sigma factor (sigma-70 family)